MFDGIDHTLTPFFVGAEAWPVFADRVRPYLAKMAAGSGGRFWPEDIEACITQGRMQLWVVLDGPEIACVLVTEIMHYPRLKTMRCIGVVGHRMRRWVHLLGHVEKAAKDCFGCSRFEALHDPRHAILLQSGGWNVWHVLSEKAL